MKIIRCSLGQLQANCYFLVKDKKCLIIDPGSEGDFILEKTRRENLEIKALLATHGHFDHIMAVGEIQLSILAPLYIDKKDLFLLKRLKTTAEHFLSYKPVVIKPQKVIDLPAGSINISGFEFKIIKTPGHTPGGNCFYFASDGVIFTGDTLFKNAVGRYDFSYSSFHDLQNSLKKLFKLPSGTIVYSGHGGKTTIDKEKKMFYYPIIKERR